MYKIEFCLRYSFNTLALAQAYLFVNNAVVVAVWWFISLGHLPHDFFYFLRLKVQLHVAALLLLLFLWLYLFQKRFFLHRLFWLISFICKHLSLFNFLSLSLSLSIRVSVYCCWCILFWFFDVSRTLNLLYSVIYSFI